jgi:peptidoglycan/LPS O-acetylase OafA/YrhL
VNKSISNFLALARWIAALAVLVTHAGQLIQISDIMVAPHGPGVYAWWFLAGFSHQAVLAFFVMSGFLIGGDLLRRLDRTDPFLKQYMIDRFSRIYIVMAPALALGFVVDSIGRRIFPDSGIYDGAFFDGVFNPINILWTLLQQQNIWAPQAGTNGPLWSLACEMWYYITFPLLLAPLSRAYSTGFRLAAFACGVLGVVVMSIPESFFLLGYGVWTLGALVRLARRPLIKSTWLSLGVFLATATLVRLGARGPLLAAYPFVSTLADIGVAATFANLLLSLRFAAEDGFFADLSPIHRRLSDFSYSLYATHAPLAFFVWAGVGSLLGREWYAELPTPLHWTLAFALIAAAIVIAYGFSRVTEARTKQLRDFFARRPACVEQSGRSLRAVELSGSRSGQPLRRSAARAAARRAMGTRKGEQET